MANVDKMNEAVFKSPKILEKRKPKRRKKFEGKLSHTSSVSPNKITKFFNTKDDTLNQKNECIELSSVNVQNVSTNKSSSVRHVLQQTNSNILPNNNGEDHYVTDVPQKKFIPQKEEPKVQTLSPSTVLSHLKLSSNKSCKSRRKLLPTYNKTDHKLQASHNSVLKPCNELHNLEKTQQSKLTEYFPVRRSIRKTKNVVLAEKQKTLEEAISSKKEYGLEVRVFLGKGRGVIATQLFEKGDFVVEYAGELISIDVAQKRELLYSQDENTGCYMYYFTHKNNKYCIDATSESNRLGRLLNHSRYGNLCPKTVEINDNPHIVLIAKQDIQVGTELTYDYGDRSKKSLLHHPWLAHYEIGIIENCH